MNKRNADFVLSQNPRANYPRADNKLLTKQLAEAANIPIPRSLGVISYHHELRGLPRLLATLADFVLKPAHGAQGNGIVVITAVEDGRYRRSSGALLSPMGIRHHVSSVLSGVFSFRGDADSCLIEQRVVLHPQFRDISRYGIPDVRVILHRGVPLMAMCRLPTVDSGGRANLHQGAIGVGLDIASGRAIHAEHHNRAITKHVDTGAPILGFEVPGWNEVLALTARASEISGLSYVGVDIVVDAQAGPLLLELNARPGLAVQIANNDGLLSRLRRSAALPESALSTAEERCRIARELFGHAVA